VIQSTKYSKSGVHAMQMIIIMPGANPTIVVYNASVVNFYNATGSLMRFENKTKIFYSTLKNAGVVAVNLKILS
jgi:hypothetical protein